MENYNKNNNAQEQVREKVNTTQKTEKEQQAEKFLKSLEKDQKQVKSKTISFKCTLEDYTLIRAKAILKGVSIAEFLVELARKEKVKGYEEAKEDLKKIFNKHDKRRGF